MARKFPPLGRRTGLRDPKKKFKIFTEGKNTEPSYFEALSRFFSNTLIELEIVKAAGVPITIANKASEAKRQLKRLSKQNSYIQRDEIWAAFDKDEHPRVEEAIRICRDADVGVAFSNPCFELWLILHQQDFDRPCNRHEMQRELEKACPSYSRNNGKVADCELLVRSIADAEGRASKQVDRRENEGLPLGSPSTTVYQLTRAIKAAAENGK